MLITEEKFTEFLEEWLCIVPRFTYLQTVIDSINRDYPQENRIVTDESVYLDVGEESYKLFKDVLYNWLVNIFPPTAIAELYCELLHFISNPYSDEVYNPFYTKGGYCYDLEKISSFLRELNKALYETVYDLVHWAYTNYTVEHPNTGSFRTNIQFTNNTKQYDEVFYWLSGIKDTDNFVSIFDVLEGNVTTNESTFFYVKRDGYVVYLTLKDKTLYSKLEEKNKELESMEVE